MSAPVDSARQPADLRAHDDAVEEALFEAEVCGDAGFPDRFLGCWWPQIDGLDEIDGEDEPGVAADPVAIVGPVGWLRLAAREQAQSDARFLAAVHAVSHHQGERDSAGRPVRDAYAADEVGAALGWSAGKATYWLGLAEAAIDRLPRLHAELAAGGLDLGKVTTIVNATRGLPNDLAREVTARVVPHAAGESNADLALRVECVAAALDDAWQARRARTARSRVRLEGTRNPEGTADVALRDIGAEAGARIRARIDALAEAVRRAARGRGLRAGIVLVRALVGQRLWDGSCVGLGDDALVERLVDDLPAWLEETNGEESRGGDGSDDGGSDDGGSDDGGSDDGGSDDGGSDDGGSDDGASTADAGEADRERVRVGTVELRMRLSTALRLDDLPGLVPGTGGLTAEGARGMLDRARRGDVPTECRLVLVDGDGHLEHVLLVPLDPPPDARPRGPGPRHERGRARGQVIVELAAPTTVLADLDPDDHPGWSSWLRRARRRLVELPAREAHLGGRHHPTTTLTDAAKRLAGRELDRWVRVRDRSCIGPACSRAAHRAEIDHTRDWARGGRTVASNLGSPCPHCHRLKHEGSWRLEQTEPGRFVWTSPLGEVHEIGRRRVLDPPLDPAPRPHGRPRPMLRPVRPQPGWWSDRTQRTSLPAPVPIPRQRRFARSLPCDPDDDPPPF